MEKYIVRFNRENGSVSVKDLESNRTMICKVSEMDMDFDDAYDATIYAMKRLRDMKKKSALNCKVICVNSGTNHHFTTGKVYPIIDGVLLSDHGFRLTEQKYDSLGEFLTAMEYYNNNPCGMKFIEYKGEVMAKEDK